ncbi:hypothetical protein HRbin19_01368 [bacterium HR19]|nr:hypothetical protein HRbin19_01368 [bacterium HR19]
MKKRVLLFFLLFYFILTLTDVIFLSTPFHSEGMMMVSDIGEKISGIDFEKKEFLSPNRREKKLFLSVSIIKQDFFPYLKLKIFGLEIPILWKEYHGAIFTYLLNFLGEKLPLLQYGFKVKVLTFLYLMILGYIIFIFLVKLSDDYFFLKNKTLYILIFSLLSVSSFHFFMAQFHHLQAGTFLIITTYLIKRRKYILGGISAGLTLFSYLPLVFAVLGIFLTSLIYHRNIKKIAIALAISSVFTLPHLYYIISSQKEDVKIVYRCVDCVVMFPPNALKFHLSNAYPLELQKFLNISFHILISIISFPLKITFFLKEIFSNIKEAFSLSDVLLRYGHITDVPPLKKISDFAIILHIIFSLLGLGYVGLSFELSAFILSAFLFVILKNYFLLIPKMLYILIPLWCLMTAKIMIRFLEGRKYLFFSAFTIACLLRVVDMWNIKELFPGRLSLKDNYEVIKFFEDRNINQEKILIYAFPPAFKIYSNNKINPAVFLPIFEKIEPDMRERTIEFIINEGKWEYIVFDSSFEKFLSNLVEKRKLKAKLRILMKNDGYIITKIER